ncbi:MAG: ABC transporter substrate-binding protein, partial [Candidatus Binatia bacterium]
MMIYKKPPWFAVTATVLAFWMTAVSGAAGLPTEQIRSTVDRAIMVLKDPRLKPAAKTKERRDQLKQI